MAAQIIVNLRILTKEINRVVSVPYAVFFRGLLSVVQKIDDDGLYLWTITKSCQISALVAKLLVNLEKDEAAFPVLLRLIRIPILRNEVLTQSPEILQTFFLRSNEDYVYEACLVMCSNAFPDDLGLPPEYYTFIEDMLANKRSEPVDRYLRNVSRILTSMSFTTLISLNESPLRECLRVWHDASRTQSSSTFICFLFIAVTLHRMAIDVGASFSCCDSAPSSPTTLLQVWIAKCSTLFCGEKVLKTVRTILLRTLQLVSGTSVTTSCEIAEYLDMVRVVLEAVPREVSQGLGQDQDILQVLAKLAKKSMLSDTPMTIRHCIWAIILTVDPDHHLGTSITLSLPIGDCNADPDHERNLIERTSCLSTISVLCTRQRYWQLFLELEKYCMKEESFVLQLMQFLVSCCRPGIYSTIETTLSLQLATGLASDLRQLLQTGDLHRDNYNTIVATSIPDWWTWNLASSDDKTNCSCSDLCSMAFGAMQRKLKDSIAEIVMLSTCSSPLVLSEPTCGLLWDGLLKSTDLPGYTHCKWPKQFQGCQVLPPHLPEVSTSSDLESQEQVDAALTMANQQIHQIFWYHVNRTCIDLQHRCQGIEEPLNVERERSKRYQEQLVDIQKAMDIMEANHKARELFWQNSLDEEQKNNATLTHRMTELTSRVSHLEAQTEVNLQRALSANETITNISEQCKSLRYELDRKELEAEQCHKESELLRSHVQTLETDLKSARDKEHHLLHVLQGHRVVE